MKCYRLVASSGESAIDVQTADGAPGDLTSIDGELAEHEEPALAFCLSGLDMDTPSSRPLED